MDQYKPAKLATGGGKINADWYAYFYVRDPVTDKWKLFKKRGQINYIKTRSKKKEYGALLVSEINKLLSSGWSPLKKQTRHLTLIDALQELIDLRKETIRRRSWQSYKYAFDSLKKWLLKKDLSYLPPTDFTPVLARQYFDDLLRLKQSGYTFNAHRGFLSTLFNNLIEREAIISNPLKKIKPAKEEVGKNMAFSDKQKKELSEYLIERNYRLYLFTQFIYFCFIRPLELLRLKVSNVDLKKGMIFIYGDQSKNKKSESVIIPDAFLPLVKSMNLEQFDQGDYIFGFMLQTRPESYSRNSVTKLHKEALRACEFSDEYTLYGWKHSGVTAAYNAGIDLYSIMKQCRHSSLLQTQTYLKSLGLQPNTEFGTKMK